MRLVFLSIGELLIAEPTNVQTTIVVLPEPFFGEERRSALLAHVRCLHRVQRLRAAGVDGILVEPPTTTTVRSRTNVRMRFVYGR